MSVHRTVLALPLVVLLWFALPSAAAAQAPFCAPGQQPEYSFGFAHLHELLGPLMGEPVSCAYADPRGTGDVLQLTTEGLAYWRKATNTPTFTNGWDHWAWTEQGLVYWTGTSIEPPPSAEPIEPPAGPPTFATVEVPLIALDGGNIGCGDGIQFVERQISPTTAPLSAAVEELLGIDEQFYGQSGLYNALYQSDLQVDSIDIENGQAIIRLAGQLRLGGACDVPRVEAQLQRVALQFETVDAVQVFINDQPLEDVLSQR